MKLLYLKTKRVQCLVSIVLNQQHLLLTQTSLAVPSYRICRCIQTSLIAREKNKSPEEDKKKGSSSDDEVSKDKPVKIFLLGKNEEKLGFRMLEDAEKLAKTKGLKLVKIEDPRGIRAEVYQLLTGEKLHEERMKLREAKKKLNENEGTIVNKGDKVMVIGGKISEHDLAIKIKTLQKWLSKAHVVRVNITHVASESVADRILSEIAKAAIETGGQVLQKRFSAEGASLRFTLQLRKKEIQKKTEESAE